MKLYMLWIRPNGSLIRSMEQLVKDTVESLRSEFLALCKEHVGGPKPTDKPPVEVDTSSLGGWSSEKTNTRPTHALEKPLKLPPLPIFERREDVDALDRWLTKLEKHAKLTNWSQHTKLLQFELHLSSRAERVYGLLAASVKVSFEMASRALRERLYPIESEALVSEQ